MKMKHSKSSSYFYLKPSKWFVVWFRFAFFPLGLLYLVYFDFFTKNSTLFIIICIASLIFSTVFYPIIQITDNEINILRLFKKWVHRSISIQKIENILIEKKNTQQIPQYSEYYLNIKTLNSKQSIKFCLDDFLSKKNLVNKLKTLYAFDYSYQQDYSDELYYEKWAIGLSLILSLQLIVFLLLMSAQEFIHLNTWFYFLSRSFNNLIFLIVWYFVFLWLLPKYIDTKVSSPFKPEKNSIIMALFCIPILCIPMLQDGLNLWNEKFATTSFNASFELIDASERRQSWKAQNTNFNDEFTMYKRDDGFNEKLEKGKTYQIKVYKGIGQDYFIKADGFLNARVIKE